MPAHKQIDGGRDFGRQQFEPQIAQMREQQARFGFHEIEPRFQHTRVHHAAIRNSTTTSISCTSSFVAVARHETTPHCPISPPSTRHVTVVPLGSICGAVTVRLPPVTLSTSTIGTPVSVAPSANSGPKSSVSN